MTYPSENDFVSHQNDHSAYFSGNAFADDYGFQQGLTFNYEEMGYSPDDFKYADVEGSTLTMD